MSVPVPDEAPVWLNVDERVPVFMNIVALLALFFGRQYRVQRGKPSADEFLELGRALLATFVIVGASTYVARERLISRAVVVFTFVLAWLFTWALRRILRSLHRRVLEMQLDLRRVAIVGTREESRQLRSRLSLHPELGLDIVGYVDAEHDTRNALGMAISASLNTPIDEPHYGVLRL